MVIEQQAIIQKADIRTMKKDLARLREADAAKESRKISSLESRDMEAQKQKLFLMESQKSDLQDKLAAMEKEASKVTVPSNTPAKQEQLEQSLSSVIDRQEKEPDEIKKEYLEKQRWMAEKKLADAQQNVAGIEAKRAEITQKKQDIAANAAALDEEVKKATAAMAEAVVEAANRAGRMANSPVAKESPNPAPKTREDLLKTATAENEQRRRFMEDIEKWANSN